MLPGQAPTSGTGDFAGVVPPSTAIVDGPSTVPDVEIRTSMDSGDCAVITSGQSRDNVRNSIDDIKNCNSGGDLTAHFTSQSMTMKQHMTDKRVYQNSPIIQFSAFIYYCLENEPEMTIDVMRIGNLNERSEVLFSTVDATATAGVKYEHTEGKLIFVPGASQQTVKVPLIISDQWDTTLEFVVEFKSNGLVNAALGRYLWQCRVKIIKEDAFPTNRFARHILDRRLDRIPKYSLLLEYIKMNLTDPKVYSGTRKLLSLQLLQVLYIISVLGMITRLVDHVLLDPGEDSKTSWILSAAICFPPLCLHYLDNRRIGWKIEGASRSSLQKNLLRKFLNYTETARHVLRDGDLIVAMTRDVDYLVNKGFMKIFPIAQGVMIFFFTLAYQLVRKDLLQLDKDELRVQSLCLVAFLFLMPPVIWHRFRNPGRQLLQTQVEAWDELCRHVADTGSNYRLIADYNKRPFFVERHERRIMNFNHAAAAVERATANNCSFSYGIGLAMIFVYVPFGGEQVRDNKLGPGAYVTTLAAILFCCHAWTMIFVALWEMQTSFRSMERLVTLMNLPIDLQQRMKVNRYRRNWTMEQRDKIRGSKMYEFDPLNTDIAPPVPVDLLPLQVTNLCITKHHLSSINSEGVESLIKPLQYDGTLDITQGQFVVLVGPQGEGKSTLLRLLADNVVFDDSNFNNVYVPSHLRVLHVTSEPLFFHGTLMANLTFGVHPDDKATKNAQDARTSRVLDMCRQIGLSQEFETLLHSNKTYPWDMVLSQCVKHQVNIVRALIANPEVLCCHKPSLVFDDEISEKVLLMLKQFVEEKGLQQDAGTIFLRRPRTCIITSTKQLGIRLADQVFHVASSTGIRRVEKDDIDANWLA